MKGKSSVATAYNLTFAYRICYWLAKNGYNPYASHVFFTQFLSDHNKEERELGIALGLEWGLFADEVWFCFKHAMQLFESEGMKAAYKYWKSEGTPKIRFARFSLAGDFIRFEEDLYAKGLHIDPIGADEEGMAG